MHEFITDQSFDLNRTREYMLSIQVSLDGFSFSVIHPDQNQLMALKNTPVTISEEKFLPRRLTEWFHQEELFNHPFSNIKISYNSPAFTLIPSPLAQERNSDKIINLLFGQDTQSRVMENAIEQLKAKLLFSIPYHLLNLFDEKWDDYTLFHPAAILSEITSNIFLSNPAGILLHFDTQSFLLFLYQNQNLILLNRFTFNHVNDIVYYLMTAMKQSGITTKNCKLLLSGNIREEEEVENRLKNYFNQIGFLIPDLKSDSEKFYFPMHRFISLF